MHVTKSDDRQLRQAQAKFLNGQDLPRGLMPDTIRRSWERMRDLGLQPNDKAMFEHSKVVPAHSLDDDLVVRAALSEMEELRRTLNSPAWTVLFVDASGTIVRSLYDHNSAPREIRVPLQAGRSIHEAHIGTNAPGCVLAERRPLVVQGLQHFLLDLDAYVCAAAPVFGVDDELIGVLDVTGYGVNLQDHLLDHVSLAARTIEGRLFSFVPKTWLLKAHFRREFLGTSSEGVLAISEETGTIVAANAQFCRMFGVTREDLVGVPLGHLFEDSDLDHKVGENDTKLALCHNGRRFFVRSSGRTHNRLPVLPAHVSARQSHKVHTFEDPCVQQAFVNGCRASAHGLSLLITGETGSGKEVLARAIHESRDEAPFVALNCSAIPETLIESEIFGYADGAFTGARKGGAMGAIEQASGGTLFLDEVGDAPLSLQAKLLRVLQEGVLCRLGSRKEIKVDLSIIAATHRDLKTLIREGAFREDLYYRLNGLTLRLPPLRERLDIETLIDDLIQGLAPPGTTPKLSADVRHLLLGHPWPGNVRQMRQVLSAAIALADDISNIRLANFPPDFVSELICAEVALEEVESEPTLAASQEAVIMKTLVDCQHNVSEAARRLKISRTTVYKYFRNLNCRNLNT